MRCSILLAMTLACAASANKVGEVYGFTMVKSGVGIVTIDPASGAVKQTATALLDEGMAQDLTAMDHARGIALGKKSAASAAASTARTPSARPAAPRASASILSRRPGTVASANRSTSDPEAPGSDARSLASSSSVER